MKYIENINKKRKNKNLEIIKDQRGTIIDIFYNEKINHVALIDTKKNVLRGNHFHKKTIQYTLVLSGKLRYYSKKLNSRKIYKYNVSKGDLIITPKNTIHAFKFLAKTQILVFTSGLRGGKDFEKDTFRKKIIN